MLLLTFGSRSLIACPYRGSLVMECDRIAGFDVTPATASSLMSFARLPSFSIFLPMSSSQMLCPSWCNCTRGFATEEFEIATVITCKNGRRVSVRPTFIATVLPDPVAHFRHVFAPLDDVQLVVRQLTAHQLPQVGGPIAQLRNTVYRLHNQVEPIQIIAHDHVERRRRRTLLLIAAHVNIVMIRTPVSEAMNQPWITMEGKDHGLVSRKQ